VPVSLKHCKVRLSTFWGLCGRIWSKLGDQQPCHQVSFLVFLSLKSIQLRTLKVWPSTSLSLPSSSFRACYWLGQGCSSASCASGSPGGFSPKFCPVFKSKASLKMRYQRRLGLSWSHFWKRAGILLYQSLRSHRHPLSQTTFERFDPPQELSRIASWFLVIQQSHFYQCRICQKHLQATFAARHPNQSGSTPLNSLCFP